MKKYSLTCLLFFFINLSFSQSTSTSYKIKAEYLYGNIIPLSDRIKTMIDKPVMGAEFSLEYQTVGERSWHYFLNFPIVGLGATWLNLGNQEKLGDAFAIYPYLNFPLLRNKFFSLSIKAGAGVSFLTKTYYNTNKDANGNTLPSLTGTNSAIGSVMNVYFAGGGNLEIPLGKGFSLSAEYTWNHMSNGSVIAPNEGLNLLNSLIGIKYSPNYQTYRIPQQREIRHLTRNFTTEIIASGGIRQLYYQDHKFFPCGSLTIAEFYPLSNFYQMGLGVDLFYDGVFGEVNASSVSSENETKYIRTYITSDELKNKLRAGISWQHELIIGKLTAGIHIGVYLYNQVKYLEPVNKTTNKLVDPMPEKGIIYSYDINPNSKDNGEDGWLYTRASLKYSLSKHIFASIGLKTHLQKAEFIEWGLGYRF